MSNIKSVHWITTVSGTIGIVLADNEHQKKAYIKIVAGFNEEYDIQDIVQKGGKIDLFVAEEIVKHLKQKL